ncbi:hypothetical protein [Actinomadura coerulea]|uniref:hypothetical protein n=1 Tax=Actinomadura coerulea TaxID=46159 RepID=UPI003442C231
MSKPIMGYLADPWGQEVPEILQGLRPLAMKADDEHAGMRREVGGPSLPLRGAALEACSRLEIFADRLGLEGFFLQPEAILRTTASGPERVAYAGHLDGGDVDHWCVGGDLDHALETAPEVITLLVGAGSLRGRRRPVARTADSTIPLESLASGRFLATMDNPVESIRFEPGGALLGTLDAGWLLARSVAKLVRCLPGDGPAVRIVFRVPAEEYWLPLLPALHQNFVSPELCTPWFEETKRDRRILRNWFTDILKEMLGEHLHRVQMVPFDALHDVGNRLEADVVRGEKPSALGLSGALSRTDALWEFVLRHLDDPARLVRAADVVNLLTYGRDGLAIVVDEANTACRMIGLAERFARLQPDAAARMVAIGPLGKILGGTPGPGGPFVRFRGNTSRMVVLDPEDPSKGDCLPTDRLFRELYFVR